MAWRGHWQLVSGIAQPLLLFPPQALEEDAAATQRRMDAANALISALGGEEVRWKAQAAQFSDTINRLIGDCAIASRCTGRPDGRQRCCAGDACVLLLPHLRILSLIYCALPSPSSSSGQLCVLPRPLQQGVPRAAAHPRLLRHLRAPGHPLHQGPGGGPWVWAGTLEGRAAACCNFRWQPWHRCAPRPSALIPLANPRLRPAGRQLPG